MIPALILHGGVFAGRRIFSEQALRRMTSNQTGGRRLVSLST
jgi:hypothetical protein